MEDLPPTSIATQPANLVRIDLDLRKALLDHRKK